MSFAPDFVAYVIGAGQLAALLGIFYRAGAIVRMVKEHERRISYLEERIAA